MGHGRQRAEGNAASWRDALGPRQVLVKAAGNSGTDYSAATNQLATATDGDGNLILNMQILIVGNWIRQQPDRRKSGRQCLHQLAGRRLRRCSKNQ